MNKVCIKDINIEDLHIKDLAIDYADEDFVAINNLRQFPYDDEAQTYRVNCFMLIYFIEGSFQMDLNGSIFHLKKNDLLFCLPAMIIKRVKTLSPHYRIKVLGFSTGSLHQILKMDKRIWETFTYVYHNPVKTIEHKKESPFQLYRDFIQDKISHPSPCYHKEIIRHLFAAILYEIMAGLHQYAHNLPAAQIQEEPFKRADFIFRKFMEKLSADNGSHRSVAYYAEELFYTSKYLSKVVKTVSGKQASKLIDQHAIECIKFQLRHSDKSIKEIAKELNFSNLSFFAKYVKKHLGVSPTHYRNSFTQ